MITKVEGTTETTANIGIKGETTDKIKIDKKRILMRCQIALRPNGYPTRKRKGKKIKREVKYHQYIKKQNQRRQMHKTKGHDALINKISASQ